MPIVDPSGFLYEEIRKAKARMEKALSQGDNIAAAKQAKRVAELLRELARVRKWGQKELLSLANEYEQISRSLYKGSTPGGTMPGLPSSHKKSSPRQIGDRHKSATGRDLGEESNEIDTEFDAQAEALITKANVSWDDIAGLEDVKKSIIEALFYSLAKPVDPSVKVEPPRRFLLFGPPGTGKTMLAMAASNMLGATFMYVSVDRVLSRYVGDAPRMISAIFRVARRHAPTIIFFDEVETLMMRRDSGREAASGLVQTLLTELDGFKTKQLEKPIIVMAATNKPWILDEAILSRFEKRIYVPLPDKKAREAIFRLNIEKKGFQLEGISYKELAELTEGYSGRDIANACREAIMYMLRRSNPDIYEKITSIKSLSELERLQYNITPIKREEILEALRKIKPPITSEEIRKYEEWARTH